MAKKGRKHGGWGKPTTEVPQYGSSVSITDKVDDRPLLKNLSVFMNCHIWQDFLSVGIFHWHNEFFIFKQNAREIICLNIINQQLVSASLNKTL